jgi:preflagellin peptidase FlaK
VLDIASGPDTLRLLAIPFFGYVAWLDIRTRRVPNRTWIPLALLAVVLLVWDVARVMTGDVDPVVQQNFYIQTLISVGFVVPLAYVFWLIGGFGGADAKAFFVVALLFPTYPSYELWRWSLDGGPVSWLLGLLPGATYFGTLPMVEPSLGVFSITILSNTVVMGALYPVALAARNVTVGYFSPGMFVAKPVRWNRATEEYGTLLQMPDRSLGESLSLSGLAAYFSFRGVDLDALRMYLRWRGLSLAELREEPDRYRNPASLPPDPNLPGDGAIPVEGWADADHPDEAEMTATAFGDAEPWAPETHLVATGEDPWGAAAFLDHIEGSAYGTSPATLREGLETLADDDVVWISPGIPFLVPLFVGLVLAFVYGDVLFAMFRALGIGTA